MKLKRLIIIAALILFAIYLGTIVLGGVADTIRAVETGSQIQRGAL